MIKDFKPRLYQETILSTAATHNTLVVLPTGLGKTGIALMLTAQRLKTHPESKTVILTPTKPLADQHLKTFKKHLKEERLALFTGATPPEKRKKIWKETKIIFSTPQGFENDIIANRINLKEVSLIVFDEAHRAVGNYSYVYIAKKYHEEAENERILALTASPGDKEEVIEEVCKNLHIEKVEVRTYNDPDVKPYIQPIKTTLLRVEMPQKHKEIQKILKEGLTKKLEQIRNYGYLKNPPSAYTKTKILELTRELFGERAKGNTEPELLRSISLAAEALKLEHCLELLETQGINAAKEYMHELQRTSRTSKIKAVTNIVKDLHFRTALIKTENIEEEDPKIKALRKIIEKTWEKGKKILIFTQYRTQATRIKETVEKLNIKTKTFIGQTKKKGEGLTQKEQIKVLEEFKKGEIDCLVATSVAEEGLDIPSVETVIFYEPIPSAIRTVQRRGRTGRHQKGEVYIIITKGTRDEAYHYANKGKERRMQKTLENIRTKLNIKKEENRTIKEYTEKIKIIADNREQGSNILRKLSEKNTEITFKNLEIGDYVASDRVVIEIKTPQDFVNSIIDGRIFYQARELKKYEKPILIITGEENIYTQRSVNPNSIRGVLASLITDYGISIITQKTPTETAELIYTIAKREQTWQEREPVLRFGKPQTTKEIQEYIIGSLPGIGPKLAKPLLKKFKTIKKIMQANEKELTEIPQIGKQKAKRISEILEAEYKD